MEAPAFGARLRELRQQARMTQKELAAKVGIDFTYLSKIEKGAMPPPSEKVILKLAEVLNADKDELMLLAGKIPSDIAQILTNREALQRLRSARTWQMVQSSDKKRGKLPVPSKIFLNKSFSRVAIAVALVLAVIGSLWFAAPTPVKAVEATLDLPPVMYSGGIYTFYAQLDINTNEVIPITNFRLDITGPTPIYCIFNVDGTITSGSSQFVSITPVVLPSYGYGYLYGFGYGYQPPSFGYFGWGWGYGYGYGVGLGKQAKYLVTLNTAGMTLGTYTAQLSVNVPDAGRKFLSPEYSFTLRTAPALGAGAPIPPVVTAVGSIDLTRYVDVQGKTTTEIRLTSTDGLVTVVIPRGTRILDAQSNILTSIQIIVLHTPPPPPGYVLVGPAYDCLPAGATFEPAIALTFSYSPTDIPAGVSEEDLVLAYWDGDDWIRLPTTVDTVANTVTASVSHFTPFAILAQLPPAPAVFTVSDLTVTPDEVDVGETVTISVLLANTGEATGSYEVTLKINGVVVTTKEVTVAGGTSQEVTFTTTRDVAGTYTVDVNGLVDEFVVKVPPVPPAPAAFEVSQLSISPVEVQVGEKVTISARVANTGEVQGSYTVTLKIDGATEATKQVTLAGGQSTTVNFSVVRDVAATYQVDIDGQTGSFTVTKPPLAWWIWLIVGLVVVAVVIILVVILRRRTY